VSAFTPDAAAGLRRVFIRRLEVRARLGIYPHEAEPQRVLIDVELLVQDGAAPHHAGDDSFDRVVDYEAVVVAARAVAAEGHTLLAETLAERIALAALADPRTRAARVTVEKLDIFPDVAGVGVTVERLRPQ
jgi:7,8-dihydroneopterin aldolase/epimerase/oxygenase